jgi:hypothetical protein
MLETFSRHGVDFILVGGLAGLAHGSAYPTFDLDIAYAPDHPNLVRMVAALADLEVSLRNAPPDLPFQLESRTLENGANFTFDTKCGPLDIVGHLRGVRSYAELRDQSMIAKIEGVDVRVASIDHLIAMKRAANRTKDRLMLEEYIGLADEQQRAPYSS